MFSKRKRNVFIIFADVTDTTYRQSVSWLRMNISVFRINEMEFNALHVVSLFQHKNGWKLSIIVWHIIRHPSPLHQSQYWLVHSDSREHNINSLNVEHLNVEHLLFWHHGTRLQNATDLSVTCIKCTLFTYWQPVNKIAAWSI